MFRTWTLPTKATLTAALCSTAAVVGIHFFLARTRSPLGVWLVLAIPFAGCVAVAWLFTWYVTQTRYSDLIRAYEQLATSDWKADMPDHAPDPQAAVVRGKFLSMASALAEARARLEQVDAQRRRLFADLSHELSTPITSVLGIAAALAQPDSFPAAERVRLIAHLQHEAERLQRLAEDVRALALLDDPDTLMELRPTDLGELARSAAERTQALAGTRIAIACRADAAPCQADPQRLDQVLTNLLSNALRYTPDGGRIALDVTTTDGAVQLTVEDSGSGVPDELLPRLGERLLRIDPSRSSSTGGHGLGLSIVAAVIERHGGKLSFARAALGGLRVVVRLPARLES